MLTYLDKGNEAQLYELKGTNRATLQVHESTSKTTFLFITSSPNY